MFSPRFSGPTKDNLSQWLMSWSKYLLILGVGLLPILFIPGVYAALGFTKTYFFITMLFLAVVFAVLATLRSGSAKLPLSWPLGLFWAFTIWSVLSALLSGDFKDAFWGNVLEVGSAGFLLLLAVTMTVVQILADSKGFLVRLFILLGVTSALLQVYHLLRMVFGSEFLSFGLFTNQGITLVGSLNDLAVYAGLVLLATLSLVQVLSIRLAGKVLAGVLVLSSLLILSAINFYVLWFAVGFFSLLSLLYLLTKDTWSRTEETGGTKISKFALALVGLTCLWSGLFLIGGDWVAGVASRVSGISYLEVRPALTTTVGIARDVASEDVLFGIGPNRFEDAWRLHKDQTINQTQFWGTNFTAGSGYLTTSLVTTGLVGGVILMLFVLVVLYRVFKLSFVNKLEDAQWQTLSSTLSLAVVYLWIVFAIYVPGPVLLILVAVFSGLVLAIYGKSASERSLSLNVLSNRRQAPVLIGLAVLALILSSSAVFMVGKQYSAVVTYAGAVSDYNNGATEAEIDVALMNAHTLFSQDLFLAERASLRLVNLASQRANPAEFDENRYAAVLSEGVLLTEDAISMDRTQPANYILLTNFYRLLDHTQFEGLAERVEELLRTAKSYDPVNPIYDYLLADYQVVVGKTEAARGSVNAALALKPNYTEALFLLAQLDIRENKVEDALAVARTIIATEPNNPARYFQIGVLLASAENLDAAEEAFTIATRIDPNFANAKYFLALVKLDKNQIEEALALLEDVRVTNADNQELLSLIDSVKNGAYQAPVNNQPPVSEESVSVEGEVVTSEQLPDTDLVAPLNRPGQSDNNSASGPESSETAEGGAE